MHIAVIKWDGDGGGAAEGKFSTVKKCVLFIEFHAWKREFCCAWIDGNEVVFRDGQIIGLDGKSLN